MPDLQTALISRISSALGHARVYWGVVPQGKARPYVRMNVVSDPRPEHLTGYQRTRITRVQVDVFGPSYEESRSVSEAIIAAVANPATVEGIKFGRTKAKGPRDLGEDVTGVGYVHRLSTDLLTEHSLA